MCLCNVPTAGPMKVFLFYSITFTLFPLCSGMLQVRTIQSAQKVYEVSQKSKTILYHFGDTLVFGSIRGVQGGAK